MVKGKRPMENCFSFNVDAVFVSLLLNEKAYKIHMHFNAAKQKIHFMDTNQIQKRVKKRFYSKCFINERVLKGHKTCLLKVFE